MLPYGRHRFYRELECEYDRDAVRTNELPLKPQQKEMFGTLINAIDGNYDFFPEHVGWIWKTSLIPLIFAAVRARSEIPAEVASSEIAARLQERAHKQTVPEDDY